MPFRFPTPDSKSLMLAGAVAPLAAMRGVTFAGYTPTWLVVGALLTVSLSLGVRLYRAIAAGAERNWMRLIVTSALSAFAAFITVILATFSFTFPAAALVVAAWWYYTNEENAFLTQRPRWLVVAATSPLSPIGSLLIFAAVARLKLGFWPRYDRPDPNLLRLPILDFAPLVLFVVSSVAVAVAFVVIIRRWFSGHRDWTALVLASTSLIFVSTWLSIDPGGFVEWWAD